MITALAAVLAMIAIALGQWQHPQPIDLAVTLAADQGADSREAAYAASYYDTSSPSRVPVKCEIVIRPLFWDQTAELQQAIATHEVGHCLGLSHPNPPVASIMNDLTGGITELDRARLRDLWPLPYRLALPMVAE